MARVTACDVPENSLLAEYGGPGDYRDCFVREVAGEVSLAGFIERFYSSMAFRPERVVLGLIGRGSSADDIRALARGEGDRLAVWEVVGRRADQILLLSKDTNTASWLAVEPSALKQRSGSAEYNPSSSGAGGRRTRLLFGSWVGGIEESRWKFMLAPHV